MSDRRQTEARSSAVTLDASAYGAESFEMREPGNGHAWALGFSACLIVIVCIRFFSEQVRLLPALTQYIDVPITAVLAFCALLNFVRRGYPRGVSRLGTVVFLFLLVALGSISTNTSRAEVLPAGMFIFSFLSPLIFAVAVIGAPLKRSDIHLVMRTFFGLGIVQLVVSVAYSLPKFFASGNPDYVSGTFGRNAYQFTYFIGLWFLYVIGGTLDQHRRKRRFETATIALVALLVFGLFYAAQYRAMLVFFTLVILFTLWASPVRLSKRLTQSLVIGGVSVVMLIVVGTAYPGLKLLKVFDLVEDSSPITQSGKVQAVLNVGSMYADMPHTALLGSGPATFSSRSFRAFSSAPKSEEAVGGVAVGLMGGLYATDVANRYVWSIDAKPIQGGTTASSPFSSYISLAAEVGILGLIIYLSAYTMALFETRRRLVASADDSDPLSTRLAFTCFGGLLLLLVQAVFDNWLETTRVTIPLWTLVGLLYALRRAEAPASSEEPERQSPMDPLAATKLSGR